MKEKVERLKYVDWSKGLGILTIVFMHYEAGVIPWQMNIFMGSYMITLFFVVSGWLMSAKDVGIPMREYFNQRCRSLMYPYIVWSILIIAWNLLLWLVHYYDAYTIERDLYKTLVLRGIGTLWFLPALFFANLLWYRVKRMSWMWVMLSLIICEAYQLLYDSVFCHYNRIAEAPLHTIKNITMAYVAVAFGYYAYKIFALYQKKLGNMGPLVFGCCFSLFAFFCANELWRVLGKNADTFWGLLAPLWGPLGIILIFYGLEKFMSFRFLEYWGVHSLSMMLTHYSFTLLLATILLDKCWGRTMEGPVSIFFFIVSLPVQYGLSEWINRCAPYLLKPSSKCLFPVKF
jgi:fucose 4-O-acetylase-like acetyltransferase